MRSHGRFINSVDPAEAVLASVRLHGIHGRRPERNERSTHAVSRIDLHTKIPSSTFRGQWQVHRPDLILNIGADRVPERTYEAFIEKRGDNLGILAPTILHHLGAAWEQIEIACCHLAANQILSQETLIRDWLDGLANEQVAMRTPCTQGSQRLVGCIDQCCGGANALPGTKEGIDFSG